MHMSAAVFVVALSLIKHLLLQGQYYCATAARMCRCRHAQELFSSNRAALYKGLSNCHASMLMTSEHA